MLMQENWNKTGSQTYYACFYKLISRVRDQEDKERQES